MHDVEQRLVDLADVVKESDAFDRPPTPLIETGRVGDDQSVGSHPADMMSGLGVVRLNGVEKCLEGSGGEPFDSLAGSALSVGDHAAYGGSG